MYAASRVSGILRTRRRRVRKVSVGEADANL
jgi:hypothetical protein